MTETSEPGTSPPEGAPLPPVAVGENKGLVVVGNRNNITYQQGGYVVTPGLGDLRCARLSRCPPRRLHRSSAATSW